MAATVAGGGGALRPARHHVQQRRRPDAAARAQLEDHTVEDFERLMRVNVGGVFLGCKHAVIQFKKQGDGRRDPQHGVGGRARRMGRHRLRRYQGRRAPADPGGRRRGGAVRHPLQRHLPGRDAVHQLHGRRRHGRLAGATSTRSASTSVPSHPLGRPITAEDCAEVAVFWSPTGPPTSPGILVPIDGGYVAR